MNILQSIYQGYLDVVDISKLILQTFGQILIGNKSLDEIGGTITIAKESGNSLAQGPISFVLFLAMLSVNLGLLNFLPIPVLDGGHLAFIIYQVIFGKPVNQSIKNIIITLGVGLLVFFIVISIANDIKGIVF